MSADLQWELVRNFNSGLVKRSGCTFSKESFNLTSQHSYKFSGFAQNKVSSQHDESLYTYNF